MKTYDAFTDGSSRKNGKPGCVAGWSFVAFIENKRFIRYGTITKNASNNVGEIAGVLYATLVFGNNAKFGLNILSDSKYVVNSVNEWQHKHALNDYLGIKNSELFVPLYNKWNQSNNLKLSWVKSHSGNAGNEIADEYAGLGADASIRNVCNESFNIKYISEKTLEELYV